MKRRKIAITVLICMLFSVMSVFFVSNPLVYAAASDRYITATGAGNKDGTSLSNAWDYRTTTLSTAWNSTPADGTLYVGSGSYGGGISVTTSTDGTSASVMKRLVGLDTGDGKPVVTGSYNLGSTSSSTFFTLGSGVCFVGIENFVIKKFYNAIKTTGNSSYIEIKNVDTYISNNAVLLNGGGTTSNTLKLSNVLVENCNFYYYYKDGIRTSNRVDNIQIKNCLADAGGPDYYTSGAWPVGFRQTSETSLVAETNITYTDCTALNNYQSGGDNEYWNSDGFSGEGGCSNITYIRCKSFGATDGGWDSKGTNLNLIDCIAMDNKKNFRFWGSATLNNCLSAYAFKRGGNSVAEGLWADGTVNVYHSTIYNNGSVQIDTDTDGVVTLYDSIVASKVYGSTLYSNGGTITLNNSAAYLQGSTGTDPQINVTDNTYFYGNYEKYNSGLYGDTKGYYMTASGDFTAPPAPTPEPTPTLPAPVLSNGRSSYTLYAENFESYSDASSLVSQGKWSIAGTIGTNSTKYMSIIPASSAVASRSFYPVPVTAAGGSSPGKNAKIIAEYRIARGSFNAGNSIWFGFGKDTTPMVSAASRMDTSGTSSTTVFSYAKTLSSGAVGSPVFLSGTNTASTSPWCKIRYEITFTDANGNFITPSAKAYVDDSTTALTLSKLINSVTTFNSAMISATSSAGKGFIDDISVILQIDTVIDKSVLNATIVVANSFLNEISENIGNGAGQYTQDSINALTSAISAANTVANNSSATQASVDQAVSILQSAIDACEPNPAPEVTVTTVYEENFDSYDAVGDLESAGWILSKSATDPPVISAELKVSGTNKYLRAVSGASAQITFAPVPVRAAGTAAPGAVSVGKNSKIIIEADVALSGGSSGGNTGAIKFDQNHASSPPTVISYAMRKVRPSRMEYNTGPAAQSSSYVIANPMASGLTRVVAEIAITDENGNFFTDGPKVTISYNGVTVLAGIGTISSNANYLDRIVLSGTITKDIDNISIKVSSEESAPSKHNITVSSNTGGTVTPTGTLSVYDGEGKTFSIRPSAGNVISEVKVNGTAVPSSQIIKHSTENEYYQYTLTNITHDTTVNVTFAAA